MGKRERRRESVKMLLLTFAGALWIFVALMSMEDPSMTENSKDVFMIFGVMVAAMSLANLFGMVRERR